MQGDGGQWHLRRQGAKERVRQINDNVSPFAAYITQSDLGTALLLISPLFSLFAHCDGVNEVQWAGSRDNRRIIKWPYQELAMITMRQR